MQAPRSFSLCAHETWEIWRSYRRRASSCEAVFCALEIVEISGELSVGRGLGADEAWVMEGAVEAVTGQVEATWGLDKTCLH